MSETNSTTLATYDSAIDKYIEGTPESVGGWQKQWLDEVFDNVGPAARILEVGSGLGRDADYIESKGFTVERSDATDSFVEYLGKDGASVRKLNILEDPIEKNHYDVIFASAVLLHLKRSEMSAVLAKFHDALTDGGKLAFSLKRGEGETWSSEKMDAPRFFCYWQPENIRPELTTTGYDRIHINENDSKWLGVIATKGAEV